MVYLQYTEIEQTGLKIGGNYTFLYVDSFMALTHKVEITLINITKISNYAQYQNLLNISFKQRGKRKEGNLLLTNSMLFLEGWDLGLNVDTDYSSFNGNALINLVGNQEALRQKIEQLNKYNFTNMGIIAYAETPQEVGRMMILYPEKADLNHAVVRRILKK